MTTITACKPGKSIHVAVFWLLLLLITGAEFLTAVVQPQLGIAFHTLLLIGVIVYASVAPRERDRRLALAFMLLPIIRLLSLTLPLAYLPRMIWYPAVAIPLLFAIWNVVQQNNMSRQDLGLQVGTVPLQIALVLGGLGIGAIEYLILRPAPQQGAFSWGVFLLSSINLLVFTGFTEELLFRALLQRLAVPVLGRWALLYVSLLFGVMHIGYLSATDVLFLTIIGMVFAYIGNVSGSIIGLTLAHGMSNITLFLLMPWLAQAAGGVLAPFVGPLVLISALAFMIVGGVCQLQGRLKTPSHAAYHPLRGVRLERQVDLSALARQTGIPLRRIVTIELGYQIPSTDELRRLTAGVIASDSRARG